MTDNEFRVADDLHQKVVNTVYEANSRIAGIILIAAVAFPWAFSQVQALVDKHPALYAGGTIALMLLAQLRYPKHPCADDLRSTPRES